MVVGYYTERKWVKSFLEHKNNISSENTAINSSNNELAGGSNVAYIACVL